MVREIWLMETQMSLARTNQEKLFEEKGNSIEIETPGYLM